MWRGLETAVPQQHDCLTRTCNAFDGNGPGRCPRQAIGVLHREPLHPAPWAHWFPVCRQHMEAFMKLDRGEATFDEWEVHL